LDVIKEQKHPTMYFIGVTTGQSSIMTIFPQWMNAMGRDDVRLEGIDLKLHDSAQNYRRAVAQIKHDPLALGALVTSHKINLLNAARDMFDYLDPVAAACGEVSSISKAGSQLEGHAKDPITAGMSLESLLGPGYFGRTGAEMLCLGAGGSTAAIVTYLAGRQDSADRPRRLIAVNRSQPRLDGLRAMAESCATDIEFEYHCNTDPRYNDHLMETLPAGSIVINATGMGKDLPGSPITSLGKFPTHGIAWELNYRGELLFLHHALQQVQSRHLRVEDGWLYFLHGWTQVIAQVLHTPIEPELFTRLAGIASTMYTPALGQTVVPKV
jgi:shikimate 5-dehydrogenase